MTSEIDELASRISEVLVDHAPDLLHRRGVGPDSPAALRITAGDNPQRLAAWCFRPRCANRWRG
jgi:hypothetical protein